MVRSPGQQLSELHVAWRPLLMIFAGYASGSSSRCEFFVADRGRVRFNTVVNLKNNRSRATLLLRSGGQSYSYSVTKLHN